MGTPLLTIGLYLFLLLRICTDTRTADEKLT